MKAKLYTPKALVWKRVGKGSDRRAESLLVDFQLFENIQGEEYYLHGTFAGGIESHEYYKTWEWAKAAAQARYNAEWKACGDVHTSNWVSASKDEYVAIMKVVKIIIREKPVHHLNSGDKYLIAKITDDIFSVYKKECHA